MVPKTDLNRLESYRAAVRAMRAGEFVPPPPTAIEQEDAIGALGQELAKLAEWLEQRFAEFRKLQEVATEIGSGLFTENVLDRVYDAFAQLIPYDRIGCALLGDDDQTLRAFWARSAYADIKLLRGFTARMEGSSLEPILASRQPRILNDLDAYLAEHPDSVSTQLIVAEGIRSSLTCPLVANGKAIGFLFFSSREKGTYRDLHQAIFQQIAGQVSVLIEKSRLYQQVFELNQQLIDAHRRLKEQSMHDALTGALNRGAIVELLEGRVALAERKGRPLAVIMADVDHFKTVNDTHGHLAGDAVLRAVAAAMEDCLRGYDPVGRYGGEEFLIVLDEAATAEASQIAERIRREVAALEVPYEDVVVRVTLSQGLALLRPGAETPDKLLARADAALYRAKREGRDRVCLAAD